MLVTATRDQNINIDGPGCYMARRCAFLCTAFSDIHACEKDKNGKKDHFQNRWGRCSPDCRSQPYCCPVNIEILKLGKGIVDGKEPLKEAYWTKLKESPNVTAVYETDNIVTTNQFEKFMTLFSQDIKAISIVGIEFCKKSKLGGCKNGPSGGECTGIFSNNQQQSSACSRWYAVATDAEKENFQRDACNANPNAPDCMCVNRTKQQGFLELKKFKPFPAPCFYAPCEDSINSLIPPSMTKNSIINACPTNVCQTIIEASNNGSVDISDIKSNIRCDFTTGEEKRPEGGGGGTPKPTVDGGSNGGGIGGIKTNKIIIIIVLTVVLFVILAFSIDDGFAFGSGIGENSLLIPQNPFVNSIPMMVSTPMVTPSSNKIKIKRGTDEIFNKVFY